jgi:hypothetical protein
MKKVLISLFVCLSLSTLGYSSGVFLRISGGGTYVMGGNYDDALKGQNDYYHGLTDLSITGSLGKQRAATQFGVELEYDPVDYAGVSLGCGYYNISSDSDIELTGTSESIRDEYVSLVRAFSFRASLHLYIPLTPTLRVAVTGGPELYFPSFNLDRTFGQQTILTSFDLTFDSERKMMAGIRAALGLDASFSETVSGFVQAVYRSAVFTVPQGNYTLAGQAGGSIIADLGTASYWYDEVETGGTYYPNLTLSATQPAGSDRRNVGPLKVGFGGIGLEVGLKIGF